MRPCLLKLNKKQAMIVQKKIAESRVGKAASRRNSMTPGFVKLTSVCARYAGGQVLGEESELVPRVLDGGFGITTKPGKRGRRDSIRGSRKI